MRGARVERPARHERAGAEQCSDRAAALQTPIEGTARPVLRGFMKVAREPAIGAAFEDKRGHTDDREYGGVLGKERGLDGTHQHHRGAERDHQADRIQQPIVSER